MKKIVFITVGLLTLATMTACRVGNNTDHNKASNADFQEARTIASATFGPEDTPDCIETKIKAANLPMHIEWDCNGIGWLAPNCDDYKSITFLPVSDSIHYICEVAQIIFDDEPWLCITYTEDVTGVCWLWMSPQSECSSFYRTDIFNQQAEPYQLSGHGITLASSNGNHKTIVVRYPESDTFDTVPLIKFDSED